MKKKNKKKLIIIISSIVLTIALIVSIGFISESIRQKNVINNIDEYVKNKSYVGKEAAGEYVLTLTFHNTEDAKLTINFGKENENGYYLTFKGTYELYFENSKLKMRVTYKGEGIADLDYEDEIFNVGYNRDGEITQLANIGKDGSTSTFQLSE